MPKLSHGDRGTGVIRLQQALRSAGYFIGSEDGTFGPQTDAAVRYLQSCHGLDIDGVAGDETLTALGVNVAAGTDVELIPCTNDMLVGDTWLVGLRCKGSASRRVRVVGWFRSQAGEEHVEVALDVLPNGERHPSPLTVPESIRAHAGECSYTIYVFDAERGTQLDENLGSFLIPKVG